MRQISRAGELTTELVSKPMQKWQDLAFTSHDGLRLCARHYPAAQSANRPSSSPTPRPLLCLSSFTGHAAEFHKLAVFLSQQSQQPRSIYCLDYRGRGCSDPDPFTANYTPYVELRDILDFLTTFNLTHVDVLGTSRGGINTMLLAVVRPLATGTIILNDLGPILEPAGIARLVGTLRNLPKPANWHDAAEILRTMHQSGFPALDDHDWEALARCQFKEQDGRLIPSYDEKLALIGKKLDFTKAIPDMWNQFLGLFNHPLLIIRGENSDMLSRETVDKMRTLHWQAKAVTVPGQGHPPQLRDMASLSTIDAFLRSHDRPA